MFINNSKFNFLMRFKSYFSVLHLILLKLDLNKYNNKHFFSIINNKNYYCNSNL